MAHQTNLTHLKQNREKATEVWGTMPHRQALISEFRTYFSYALVSAIYSISICDAPQMWFSMTHLNFETGITGDHGTMAGIMHN